MLSSGEQSSGRKRLIVVEKCRPKLRRHVQLRHDSTRERWVILGPERVLVPDDTAVAVLKLADGARSVAEIAQELSQTYDADVELIQADIVGLLQDLSDKGYLEIDVEG